MAGVILNQTTKTYRSRGREINAVSDLSLRIENGELLAVVGPSGCGKTTLLRLVAGLEAPTRGTIHIGDRDVIGVEPRNRNVAMVFQNYALYPHMTVAGNLAFGLRMRRRPKPEVSARVVKTAELLGIHHLLDRRPGSLSGGEQQRVALGRAIAGTPDVFLFDEPLSNLDAALRDRMRVEIKSLHRRLSATIIHVTHDQEEAVTLGDRIAVMMAGEVQQCGPPLEVYQQPASRFVAGFIGTPRMNFLPARLVRTGSVVAVETSLGKVPLSNPARINGAGPIELGIRPQHIRLGHPGADGGTAWRLGELAVTLVEPLGAEQNVHLAGRDGQRIVARVPAGQAVRVGRHVDVWVDASAVHLFAADDAGRRLN